MTYPLWGWGAAEASELTGAEGLTTEALTRAHRELERALARRVGVYAWQLDAELTEPTTVLYPHLAGYPSRRAWVEAVSWQAAWRQAVPATADHADEAPTITSERLGDHAQTYAAPVRVGGRAVAAEAHRALTAAGLLADRLTGFSR